MPVGLLALVMISLTLGVFSPWAPAGLTTTAAAASRASALTTHDNRFIYRSPCRIDPFRHALVLDIEKYLLAPGLSNHPAEPARYHEFMLLLEDRIKEQAHALGFELAGIAR